MTTFDPPRLQWGPIGAQSQVSLLRLGQTPFVSGCLVRATIRPFHDKRQQKVTSLPFATLDLFTIFKTPYSTMTVQLRTATEADAEAIATLAAEAFHPDTDTISRRLFPQHLQLANGASGDALRLWRLARKSIKLTDDRITIIAAVDNDLCGQIVGFALWEVPAQAESKSELLDSAVPSPGLDEKAFEELQTVLHNDVRQHFGDQGTNNMWRASQFYLSNSHVFEYTHDLMLTTLLPCSDLDYLAVDPKHQRRGIGKLLLNWGVKKAKDDGRDCYLVATPAGKPLYESVGFCRLQELSIFDVPHYSMILRTEHYERT